MVLRAERLLDAGKMYCYRYCHGHSKLVVDTLIEQSKFPKIDCVVGNIATPEAAKLLISKGADASKLAGLVSICTTRVISGVGVPQLMLTLVPNG